MDRLRVAPLLLVLSGPAFGQVSASQSCETISADAAKRQFDVSSVKPAEPLKRPLVGNPFATTGGPGTDDPGRFAAAHTALSSLITRAYGLFEADRLKGPSWLNEAMDAGFAVSATMPASTTQEEFCGMLRNLLAERFHLAFHYEKQSRPGYELTILPGGPKFKEFVPGTATPGDGPGPRGSDANGFPILPPDRPTALVFQASPAGDVKLSFRNNMAAFASRLGIYIVQSNGAAGGAGAPVPRVVDKTGLAGIYDIRVEFAGIRFPAPSTAGAPAVPDPLDAGPDIFSAVQKQLGLKLTKVPNVPIDVMIIDHVDRTPTIN